ncbi:MAG TPA: VOC family protein [Candidatus Binatia bacterium]|nr:VOC family protein [Candidatus Binatia bacterium]
MAKLRHIALAVPDPEAAAQFFERAFGMTRAGKGLRGWYMTDGVMNVALLNFGDEPVAGYEDQTDVRGLIHFGMWVDDVDEAEKKIVAAGGSYLTGRSEAEKKDEHVYYEIKYKTPEGFVFDISGSGWVGAVKDVVPAKEAQAAR